MHSTMARVELVVGGSVIVTMHHQIAAFIETLSADKPAYPNGADGLIALELADQATRIARGLGQRARATSL